MKVCLRMWVCVSESGRKSNQVFVWITSWIPSPPTEFSEGLSWENVVGAEAWLLPIVPLPWQWLQAWLASMAVFLGACSVLLFVLMLLMALALGPASALLLPSPSTCPWVLWAWPLPLPDTQTHPAVGRGSANLQWEGWGTASSLAWPPRLVWTPRQVAVLRADRVPSTCALSTRALQTGDRLFTSTGFVPATSSHI